VFDGHLHVNYNPDILGPELVYTFEELEQSLRDNRVDYVQVIPAFENFQKSYPINVELFEKIKASKYRNRLYGLYWPHPGEVVPDFHVNYPVAGVKYHPSVSQLPVSKAEHVLKYASDNGFFILVHCGRGELSSIDYVIEAYKKTELPFIAAHLGGLSPPLVSHALKLLGELGDVDIYLDVSSVPVPHLIRRAIDVVGADRIIFGSDIPFHDRDVMLYVLDLLHLDKKDRNMIQFENLSRLLKRTGRK
jgi:predicted TIM-barrel fold metal-dependent hydrolase